MPKRRQLPHAVFVHLKEDAAHVLHIPNERLLSLNVEYGTLTRLRVLHDRSGEWASLLTHGC